MPLVVIQGFGILVVTAILVAGVLGVGDRTILLAVLGVAGSFVALGGFYEKANRAVKRALDPESDDS